MPPSTSKYDLTVIPAEVDDIDGRCLGFMVDIPEECGPPSTSCFWIEWKEDNDDYDVEAAPSVPHVANCIGWTRSEERGDRIGLIFNIPDGDIPNSPPTNLFRLLLGNTIMPLLDERRTLAISVSEAFLALRSQHHHGDIRSNNILFLHRRNSPIDYTTFILSIPDPRCEIHMSSHSNDELVCVDMLPLSVIILELAFWKVQFQPGAQRYNIRRQNSIIKKLLPLNRIFGAACATFVCICLEGPRKVQAGESYSFSKSCAEALQKWKEDA